MNVEVLTPVVKAVEMCVPEGERLHPRTIEMLDLYQIKIVPWEFVEHWGYMLQSSFALWSDCIKVSML